MAKINDQDRDRVAERAEELSCYFNGRQMYGDCTISDGKVVRITFEVLPADEAERSIATRKRAIERWAKKVWGAK